MGYMLNVFIRGCEEIAVFVFGIREDDIEEWGYFSFLIIWVAMRSAIVFGIIRGPMRRIGRVFSLRGFSSSISSPGLRKSEQKTFSLCAATAVFRLDGVLTFFVLLSPMDYVVN